VFAHIVAAGDVGQGFGQVAVGELVEPVAVAGVMPGDAVEVPGATEVEAVEVDELPVGPVLHLPGLEVEVRTGEGRQEFLQPGMICRRGQDAPHEIGFFERGAEEVVAAGFPGDRVVGVVVIETPGGLKDGLR